MPKQLRPRAAQLLDAGLLERMRGGKYMPARAFLEGTDAFQEVRPRDLAARKLLAFLHEHAADGCSMNELLAVVPELSRSTIKRVVNELRQHGKVHAVGQRSQTRWFPGPTS
jgi:hypothetical protein